MPDLTVSSGSNAYCTVPQFLAAYDSRLNGQLVDDTGVPVPATSLAGNAVLLRLLKAASGDVEVACLGGNRYGVADLANLANSGGNGSEWLANLVAVLAFGRVNRRRGMGDPDPREVDDARATLASLAKGDQILPFLEVIESGLPEVRDRSWAEVESAHLLTNDPGIRRWMGSRAWGGGFGGYGGGGDRRY